MVEEIDLNPNAKRLLRHFRDAGLGQAAYEAPATMKALFDDIEACEEAQAELAQYGLLDVYQLRAPRREDKVGSAALTQNGIRYLEQYSLD